MQALLHGYVDGELGLLKNLEIEQHLQECSACACAHTDLQALRAAIKGSGLSYEPPPGLRGRIQAALRPAEKAPPAPRRFRWRALALAASVLVLFAGWGLAHYTSRRSAEAVLTRELVAAHVRSQMLPNHRVDIASSDRHTVKPFFDGKLDFSPPVHNLAKEGFPLIGGRLDYLDNRPVAALVYQRRQHFINLFIWPTSQIAEASPRSLTRHGYHLVHWEQAGMTFWAVSNLGEGELEEFVGLVQDNVRPRARK
jgi:anti-sigma factor RsiW